MVQISANFSISAGDLTSRSRWIRALASRSSSPGQAARIRLKSTSGIRSALSRPIGMPTTGNGRSASASSDTPSSSGCGDAQVLISRTQVRRIRAAPISGITTIGAPSAGRTRNQGRVGLCQNRVRNPVKYRISASVVQNRASKPCSRIRRCTASVRASNSETGKSARGACPVTTGSAPSPESWRRG